MSAAEVTETSSGAQTSLSREAGKEAVSGATGHVASSRDQQGSRVHQAEGTPGVGRSGDRASLTAALGVGVGFRCGEQITGKRRKPGPEGQGVPGRCSCARLHPPMSRVFLICPVSRRFVIGERLARVHLLSQTPPEPSRLEVPPWALWGPLPAAVASPAPRPGQIKHVPQGLVLDR